MKGRTGRAEGDEKDLQGLLGGGEGKEKRRRRGMRGRARLIYIHTLLGPGTTLSENVYVSTYTAIGREYV